MKIKQKFSIFLGVALGHLLLIFYLDRMASPSLQLAGTSSIMVTFVRIFPGDAPTPGNATEQQPPSPPPPKEPVQPLAVADADLSGNPAEPAGGQVMPTGTNAHEHPEKTATSMEAPEVADDTPTEEGARHGGNPAPGDYQVEPARLTDAGRIVIRVLTREDGTAETAVLQRSSGFRHLDEIALDAVRQWQFPAGPQWVLVPVKVGLRQ
jgi:protein TonB